MTRDEIWSLGGMRGWFPHDHYRLERLVLEVEEYVLHAKTKEMTMETHDIHSPHNACMYRDGCKQTQAQHAELLAALRDLVAGDDSDRADGSQMRSYATGSPRDKKWAKARELLRRLGAA